MITYGSLVWGTAAPSLIQKVQRIQNKYIRIATDAPPLTNLTPLHEELGLPTIKEYIQYANTKKLAKAELHDNPLIPECLNYIPEQRPRRNRPKTIILNYDNT